MEGISWCRSIEYVGHVLDNLYYIVARDDALDLACREYSHFQRAVGRDGNLRPRCHGGALCRRICSVGGVYHLCGSVVSYGIEPHLECAVPYARCLVGECRLESVCQIVSVMVSVEHLRPPVARCRHHVGLSHGGIEVAVYHHGVVVLVDLFLHVVAHVGDASSLSCRYHGSNLILVVHPVLQEHARCAGHSQQVGVGGERVLLYRVLWR